MVTRYTTTELIEAELRATTSFSETTVPTKSTVESWMEEADAYIDRLAGQTFAETTYTELVDYDGSDRIQLKHAPVISVTTVKYSPYALGSSEYPGWVTKVSGTDYTVRETRGEVEILYPWTPTEGSKRIEVVYVAGYKTPPGVVRMLATKLVAKRVLDTLMHKDLNEKQSGKSISVGSISITKPAEFGVNSYRALSVTIEDLKLQLTKGTGVYRYTNY